MECLKACLKGDRLAIYTRAAELSHKLIQQARDTIDTFLSERSIDHGDLCFAVVGSVGRLEALEASDFDVIPIANSASALENYKTHDKDLRKRLSEALGVKVSAGEDLTKPTSLEELTRAEAIGGDADDSSQLTKRILILSESRQAGGSLPVMDVRSKILGAYASADRTSGRHALSLCNDIARYFKTLCIEYKAKIDEENKDWCTRNIKLRHSRKIWYFSCMLSMVDAAESPPDDEDKFISSLLKHLDTSPSERIVNALSKAGRISAGRLLESYALFLEFMSQANNRAALSRVSHSARYAMTLDNPFPSMKFNSDLIHSEIMSIIDELPPGTRRRLIGWFLL